MAISKLAQLEHTSQLIIYQLKSVHKLINEAWFELELARADLRDLMGLHEEWEEENRFKNERILH